MKQRILSVLRFIAVKVVSGEGGIQTRDTLSGIYTFQAYLFNHSSTSPLKGLQK